MDMINLRTPHDFEGSESPHKRKRHSTIACECCRKLKIRCQGGESRTASPNSLPKPCDHCATSGKRCEWPEEDGRKIKRGRQMSGTSTNSATSGLSLTSNGRDFQSQDIPQPRSSVPENDGSQLINQPNPGTVDGGSMKHHDRRTAQLDEIPEMPRTDSSASETMYTTVHYYRHLGPTAIAPGHKKISLKARQDEWNATPDHIVNASHFSRQDGGMYPSLFNESNGLPVKEILPTLIDKYFEYYSDIYCFTNRRHLESLIGQGTPPVFLVSVMSTLASRFCNPELFLPYFPPAVNGRERESWEYSGPFLEKSKSMIISAISLPTPDVAAALLMMAFADFGDNNEAGLWMFTGMALRMVQELGLHRERSCLDKDEPPDRAHSNGQKTTHPTTSGPVTLESYQESSEVLLFWAVFSMDTALCNGTGRVPSLKRHEINLRLPQNRDLAVIRAGPGLIASSEKIEVFPQLARMMLSYAQSIDFLNTGSSQIRFQAVEDNLQRMERLETLKQNLMREHRLLPKEVSFGAIFYRAAVNAGQAGAYLLLHLQYYCQIAFITQESLSDESHSTNKSRNNLEAADKARHIKTNRELYKKAIKSIADMLTFTKLIDERPLLSIVYLNQPLFHAACAYSRDMLESSTQGPPDPSRLPSTAFPIPSDTSPSMVFPEGGLKPRSPENIPLRKSSQEAVESTYNFLTLIAKANYQFLRQTIKDQAKVYAGSGWVDAVLDQREKGLRDVDLSIVSDSISTFIRLHDLRAQQGAEAALQRFVPPQPNAINAVNSGGVDNVPWNALQTNIFMEADLNFDPQAFFDDYMYTELAHHSDFGMEGSMQLP